MSSRSSCLIGWDCWRMQYFSVLACSCFKFASEHGEADRGVEEHDWKGENPFAAEYEGETRMRGGGLLDGDRERDHVGPGGDRQRAERREKDQHDLRERHIVFATPGGKGEHGSCKRR